MSGDLHAVSSELKRSAVDESRAAKEEPPRPGPVLSMSQLAEVLGQLPSKQADVNEPPGVDDLPDEQPKVKPAAPTKSKSKPASPPKPLVQQQAVPSAASSGSGTSSAQRDATLVGSKHMRMPPKPASIQEYRAAVAAAASRVPAPPAKVCYYYLPLLLLLLLLHVVCSAAALIMVYIALQRCA